MRKSNGSKPWEAICSSIAINIAVVLLVAILSSSQGIPAGVCCLRPWCCADSRSASPFARPRGLGISWFPACNPASAQTWGQLWSAKRGRLPAVREAKPHAEQRSCLDRIFCAGTGARRRFHKASTLLGRLTKTPYSYKNKLPVTFWLVHGVICLSSRYIPSLSNYACSRAGRGVQSFSFWTELVVAISPCCLYLFPRYPRFLITWCFFGNQPPFGAFWAGCSSFVSLLAPLQGHNS